MLDKGRSRKRNLVMGFTRYGLHVLVKEWHHIPLGHTVFAGPQVHVAAVCRLFSHQVRVRA